MKCGTCWHLAALGGGCGAGAARGPWRGSGSGPASQGCTRARPLGGPALLTVRGAWQTSRYHQVGFSPGRRGRRKRSSSWLGEEGAACALGSKKGLLGLAGTHAPTGPPVWGRGRGRVREWPPRSRAGPSGVASLPHPADSAGPAARTILGSAACRAVSGRPPSPSSLLLPFSQCLLLPLLIPGLWGLTRLGPSPLTGGPPCRGNWFRIGDQSESFPGRFLTRIIREELAFLFRFKVIRCEPSAVGA